MDWLCLRLELEPEAADALSEALLESGAQSVSLDAPEHGRVGLSALFAQLPPGGVDDHSRSGSEVGLMSAARNQAQAYSVF